MNKEILASCQQSRERDSRMINEDHVPSLELMERAAQGIADFLMDEYPHKSFLILCGPGNNGGDGLAAARLLNNADVFCYAPQEKGDALVQLDRCAKLGIRVTDSIDEAIQQLPSYDVIVDALFGSGLSRPIAGEYERLIDAVNESGKPVVAVDMPSGIHGTKGILGPHIRAGVTLNIDTFKQGAFLPGSLPDVGIVRKVPIGLRDLGTEDTFLVTDEFVKALIRPRSPYSYKGTFGRVLMTGGSKSMHGAISMALDACFRSGCGLLSAGVPESLADMVRIRHPESMLVALPEKDGAIAESAADIVLSHPADVISCGNGMSRTKQTKAFVRGLLDSGRLVVLDADGIAVCEEEWLDRKGLTILTPHAGEFAMLTGTPISQINEDPIGLARAFSLKHPNTVLVLKTFVTVIAHHGECYVFCRPDSRLAKGGSGDMLCGIITGLTAWNEPLSAAIAGVWLHSHAALESKKDPEAFVPQDLIDSLDLAWKQLRS